MTVKVTVKTTSYKAFKDKMQSPATQSKVGDEVIKEIKTSLDAGVSPVREVRRYPRYKDPLKYPADQKPKLPVNLKLSGDMLAALEYWFRGSRMWIGIRDPKQAVKAKAHQDGTEHLPQRRFLPTKDGEEFTVTITRKIRNLYAKILSDIIRSVR